MRNSRASGGCAMHVRGVHEEYKLNLTACAKVCGQT